MVFALEAWIQPMLDTCWSPDTSRALRMLQAGEVAEGAPLKSAPIQNQGLRRHTRTPSPSTLNSLAVALQEVAQPRTWDQLPKDLLLRVLRSVPADGQRAATGSMRAVCKAWNTTVTCGVRELEPRHAVPDRSPRPRGPGEPAPRFSFHANPGPHAETALFPGLQNFRNLQKLSFHLLDGALVVNDASLQGLCLLKGLRSLDLSWDLCEITDATLLAIAGLPQLRHLDLRGASKITDTGLSLLSGLRRLETLSVHNCPQLTGVFLPALAPAVKDSLRSLDVGRCTGIGPRFLLELGHLRYLEHLTLWRCVGTTDEVLRALAPHAGGLAELNIAECPAVTDAGAADLFPSLGPALAKLNVGHCSALTPAALTALGRGRAVAGTARAGLPPLRISYSRCQEALAPYACLYAPAGSVAVANRVNACARCQALRRARGCRAD